MTSHTVPHRVPPNKAFDVRNEKDHDERKGGASVITIFFVVTRPSIALTVQNRGLNHQ